MNNLDRLTHFGEAFIDEVRIRTLKHFEAIISGKMKSSNAQEMHHTIAEFDKNEVDFISNLIASVVDETLFKTLFMFEEREWTIIEKSAISVCNVQGLDEISDGLAGELLGPKGWIKKYS